MGGDIPIVAKISLVFFFLGIISSTVEFLADYFGDATDQVDQLKRLSELEVEYGKDIKEKDRELHLKLSILSKTHRWSTAKYGIEDLPGYIYQLIYGLISTASLGVSFAFLSLGIFLLGLSAF